MEFETFLASLPSVRSMYSAIQPPPKMFRVFWFVHVADCVNASNQNASDCGCPKRLAFKTVDSYIGKLRPIFNEAGRTGVWNSLLGFANPTASSSVLSHLEAVYEEQ